MTFINPLKKDDLCLFLLDRTVFFFLRGGLFRRFDAVDLRLVDARFFFAPLFFAPESVGAFLPDRSDFAVGFLDLAAMA
ncbi:MAG: hypothetical protein ABFR19_02375 [Pseudomonadota bacterium]